MIFWMYIAWICSCRQICKLHKIVTVTVYCFYTRPYNRAPALFTFHFFPESFFLTKFFRNSTFILRCNVNFVDNMIIVSWTNVKTFIALIFINFKAQAKISRENIEMIKSEVTPIKSRCILIQRVYQTHRFALYCTWSKRTK